MPLPNRYRVLALSTAKHEYVPLAFNDHPHCEVVGVADETTAADWVHERNERLAADLGVDYLQDVDAAIDRHRPQIAVVSCEAARHAQLSVRAAQAGLHVVQDKPMAPTIADCDSIVEAVERAGVKFLLWNRNTHPSIEAARRVIHAGEIGEPRAIHVDFFFSKDAGELLGSDEQEDVPDSWLSEGELTVEGIYPLAYMRHILDLDALQAFGRTSAHFFKRHAERGVEDLATVSLDMERGVIGSLCIGRIGRPSHPNLGELRVHVIGSSGALVIAEPRPEVAVYTRGLAPEDFRNRRTDEEYDRRQVDQFVAALETGSDTLLTARQGRHIVATVTAALESARTGRPCEVTRRSQRCQSAAG